MDWITDHIQVIIAVAGAIAYWLNARRKDKAGEPADYDGDDQPDNHQPMYRGPVREQEEAMQQEENTRRIQEEIRRKIAERNAGGGEVRPPSLPHHPQPRQVPVPPLPSPAWRREQAEMRNANEYRRIEAERETAEVLERQRVLAQQLAALNERRAEAGREAKAVWTTDQPASVAKIDARHVGEVSLLHELRNVRSLRKAIVLREVLDTPVGLR